MKSISKLKDEARRHEKNEEWEKAIQAYLEVLRAGDDGEGEVELPLFNRVGDLMVRLGRPLEAVKHYEEAADRYADVGLYNNAIALCNKALRYQPGRLELMRKLGQFSAQQGFFTDARRYFLEYADRKFAAGEIDAAFAALEDFADVVDDGHVHELLGRRLQAHGRSAEALASLQRAHALHDEAGDADRAAAVLELIRTIDASAAWHEAVGPALPGPQEASADQVWDEDVADAHEDRGEADPAPDGLVDINGQVIHADFSGEGAVDDAAPWAEVDALEGLEQTSIGDATIEPDADLDLPGIEVIEATGWELPSPSLLEGLESAAFETDDTVPEFDEQVEGQAWDAGFDLPLLGDVDESFDLPLLGDPDGPAVGELDVFDAFDAFEYEQATALPELGDDDTAADAAMALDGTAVPIEQSPLDATLSLDDVGATGDASAVDAPAAEVADPPQSEGEDYIDLGALLEEDGERTTRFRVTEIPPTGDDDADFAELLNQFKEKASENLPPEDAAAHYDLALAFKEMDLLDDAIAEFQLAFQAEHMRLRVCEELGDCFLRKQNYNVAEKVLRRAVQLSRSDDLDLLGVYYHLGRACEALGRIEDARHAYEHVLGLDINFQDVANRLARL
jgi:tetratricopeptide (TPR) repeat protein